MILVSVPDGPDADDEARVLAKSRADVTDQTVVGLAFDHIEQTESGPRSVWRFDLGDGDGSS